MNRQPRARWAKPCRVPGCEEAVAPGASHCAYGHSQQIQRYDTSRDAKSTPAGTGPQYERSAVPVTIVAGAPGSGKTTWVRERAERGDLIVDIDALFSALSGLAWYDKPNELLPFVMEAREAIIKRLARPSGVGHVWIITSEGRKERLEMMASQLGAGLQVLDVDPYECYRRISADEKRPGQAPIFEPYITRWHKDYHGI